MTRLILTLAALALMLSPVPAGAEGALRVERVENMPEDFILGMDISSVLADEASGVKYCGFDGSEADLFRLLADSGVNCIRVRVWNHPFDAAGRGYGGGNCDIDTAVEIGRRAAACGMRLMVDFHYSDFWADPGKQTPPLAWEGMDIQEKAEALHNYTKECLEKLMGAGADVALVQIGNETNQFLCGETAWPGIAALMQAGARAVREECPGALVELPLSNPEKAGSYAYYARELARRAVDYDVFATSYYPCWHGTLGNLSRVLSDVAAAYGKKVMVAETAYAFTEEDSDFFANTLGAGGSFARPYPFSVQGQADCVRDVADAVVNRTGGAGIGVVYWEGAWISVGGRSWEENRALWERYGSGWASSWAAAYDPDAGRYHGGSAVDNQAFFDSHGRPLESLKVFSLMREGAASGQ